MKPLTPDEAFHNQTMRQFVGLLDSSSEAELWIYATGAIAKISELKRAPVRAVCKSIMDRLERNGVKPNQWAMIDLWRKA